MHINYNDNEPILDQSPIFYLALPIGFSIECEFFNIVS